METTFAVPYPPSVNHYWRRVGAKTLISAAGRKYRESVTYACRGVVPEAFGGRLEIEIDLHPPDARRRDLDNPLKSLLDALQHAGVYEDDEQIDRMTVQRAAKREGGLAVVRIRERDANESASLSTSGD